jgi:DNA helicase IV
MIAEEEERFEKTVASLVGELPQVREAKISANQAARELTAWLVTEWNPEERQPLVSDEAVAHRIVDIRKKSDQDLLELIREPYFGRVVTNEDDGREVEFLIGKKSNIGSGIVDWRNGPISGLYFNYQEGEEFLEVINERERSGSIKIRRSYKIEAGRMVQIDTPDGVYYHGDRGWVKLDLDAEAAAHRSRGIGSKKKTLPSILSLITREQFELITSDPDRPVLIQGSAGSGKTTVALHRLAWLLGETQGHARPEKTRVVVMNKSLQIYVSSTLPSMGIHQVEVTTFNRWALGIIRDATRRNPVFQFHNLPAFIEEIKFSDEILAAIASQVDNERAQADRDLRARFEAHPGLVAVWGEGRKKALLPRLRDFLHDVKTAPLPEAEKKDHVDYLNRRLESLEDYIGDIYDLQADPERLARFLPPDEKRGEHLQVLKRLAEKNRRKRVLDYFDMSLILRNIQIKNGGLPDKDGRPEFLDHLVIDEAQDFGPVEFAVMFGAVEDKRHITVVGDVSQKILTARKFIGWDRIVHQLEVDNEDLIQLEVSFRCTAPIMTLARRIEGRPGPAEGRGGPAPIWHHAGDSDDVLETLADWAAKWRVRDPQALLALICRTPKQVMQLKEDLAEMIPDGLRLGHRNQFSFEPGVIVTNVHQVKGLEFDAVALVEPSEDNYPRRRAESRNLLYVAITRAQEDLLLIGKAPFSSLLSGH